MWPNKNMIPMRGIFLFGFWVNQKKRLKRDYKQNVYIPIETLPFIRCYFIHKHMRYAHTFSRKRIVFEFIHSTRNIKNRTLITVSSSQYKK